jgi:hypothetical protein
MGDAAQRDRLLGHDMLITIGYVCCDDVHPAFTTLKCALIYHNQQVVFRCYKTRLALFWVGECTSYLLRTGGEGTVNLSRGDLMWAQAMPENEPKSSPLP